MIELAKYNQHLRKADIDAYMMHLDHNKRVSQYEATCIIMYVLKETIGYRKAIKVLHSMGIESL